MTRCEHCAECVELPFWEHTSVDGLFIKQMGPMPLGTVIPQHAHRYDHTSLIARGRVRVWEDGVQTGEYAAPHPLFIRAQVKHSFLALEPDTLIFCIHNVSRTAQVEIHEYHDIADSLAALEVCCE